MSNAYLSVTSELLNVAVGYLHIVNSMVWNYVLIEFSAVKAACAWFASTCLSTMQALKEGRLGLPPLEVASSKVHFTLQ